MTAELVILEISHVAKILGATRFTLDRLMRRCNIRPVSARSRKFGRVFFTGEDVGTLALAYWLYRSGLRTRAIEDVLASPEIRAFLKTLKGPEDMKVEAGRVKFLITWRVSKSKGRRPRQDYGQDVALATNYQEIERRVETSQQFGFLVIPISRLLEELAARFTNFTNES